MNKLILGSVAALALLGVAACSDSTDNTTTQSTTPPPAEQATPPAAPEASPPPATDNSTTQGIKPSPDTGTGGTTQMAPSEPAPTPAPAQ